MLLLDIETDYSRIRRNLYRDGRRGGGKRSEMERFSVKCLLFNSLIKEKKRYLSFLSHGNPTENVIAGTNAQIASLLDNRNCIDTVRQLKMIMTDTKMQGLCFYNTNNPPRHQRRSLPSRQLWMNCQSNHMLMKTRVVVFLSPQVIPSLFSDDNSLTRNLHPWGIFLCLQWIFVKICVYFLHVDSVNVKQFLVDILPLLWLAVTSILCVSWRFTFRRFLLLLQRRNRLLLIINDKRCGQARLDVWRIYKVSLSPTWITHSRNTVCLCQHDSCGSSLSSFSHSKHTRSVNGLSLRILRLMVMMKMKDEQKYPCETSYETFRNLYQVPLFSLFLWLF